jgi:hypothetical protein
MEGTVIRGLPLWLFREYLEQLGGQSQADGVMHGAGWQARLTEVEDFVLGSLRVGQVLFELSGEAEAVESLRRALEPKLMRGGG